MKKEIIINSTTYETRTAILEDDKLVELFIERPENERNVGDIYKGTVINVLPGMMAAFIDIGFDQNAFLHFHDIALSTFTNDTFLEFEAAEDDVKRNDARFFKLKEKQEVMVEVIKEPMGTKGARVSTAISLPGRYLVLIPNDSQIGVSRKISHYNEKRRLKRIGRKIRPKGFGLIIRTEGEGKSDSELLKDVNNLLKTWQKITRKFEKNPAPLILHREMGMASSVIRDIFTNETDRLVVDSKRLHRKIKDYLRKTSPSLLPKIQRYKGNIPIFDSFKIEREIEKNLDSKVWLKGGGYIVIERTEAVVTIDINSGKFVGKRDYEDNSFKVNLEAAREITRQLRLRDIGGLIIIDFIDLIKKENIRKVTNEVRRQLKKDRAKNAMLEMSDFGVLQVTRQRIRPSLIDTYSETCPTCSGTGRVFSKETVALQIERWIKRFKLKSKERRLILEAHPDVADFLSGSDRRLLKAMLRYFLLIDLVPNPSLKPDEYKFYSKKQDTEITGQFIS